MLIIVEPPLESINVAAVRAASEIGISNIWAVLNKIPSEKIAARLKEELQSRRIKVAGSLHFNEQIFDASLEGKIPAERPGEIGRILDRIIPEK